MMLTTTMTMVMMMMMNSFVGDCIIANIIVIAQPNAVSERRAQCVLNCRSAEHRVSSDDGERGRSAVVVRGGAQHQQSD